jgi:hypothetical protein
VHGREAGLNSTPLHINQVDVLVSVITCELFLLLGFAVLFIGHSTTNCVSSLLSVSDFLCMYDQGSPV